MKQKKSSWVLVFWVESSEVSVVNISDISKVLEPQFIKVGWKGELPWIDGGSTTLYDAKILQISKNKDYLESLIVNQKGKIQKKELKIQIMAERRKIQQAKKRKVVTQNKNTSDANELIQSLSNITSEPSEKTNMDTLDSCENCKNCVCREWRSKITPEFLEVCRLQNEAFIKACNKKYPDAQPSNPKIELYPKTNIFIEESILESLVNAANNKKNAFIRLLVTELTGGEEELAKSGSAEKLTDQFPKIRTAVIGYMKNRFNIVIDTKYYNKTVNHRIQYLRSKKASEEKENSDKEEISNDSNSPRPKKKKVAKKLSNSSEEIPNPTASSSLASDISVDSSASPSLSAAKTKNSTPPSSTTTKAPLTNQSSQNLTTTPPVGPHLAAHPYLYHQQSSEYIQHYNHDHYYNKNYNYNNPYFPHPNYDFPMQQNN
ncbi:uncharacterized protein, partial [Chelonus insularis]|uniref:uncharacterized protein n=1 Tax=Chelonus insularis TaxID=460826 RepID=UPI00158C99B6